MAVPTAAMSLSCLFIQRSCWSTIGRRSNFPKYRKDRVGMELCLLDMNCMLQVATEQVRSGQVRLGFWNMARMKCAFVCKDDIVLAKNCRSQTTLAWDFRRKESSGLTEGRPMATIVWWLWPGRRQTKQLVKMQNYKKWVQAV